MPDAGVVGGRSQHQDGRGAVGEQHASAAEGLDRPSTCRSAATASPAS
jgi:hypothetical protein